MDARAKIGCLPYILTCRGICAIQRDTINTSLNLLRGKTIMANYGLKAALWILGLAGEHDADGVLNWILGLLP